MPQSKHPQSLNHFFHLESVEIDQDI
jgi:hypothetical protein